MVIQPSNVVGTVAGVRLTHAKLWVDGMTCGSCAARVQRTVTKLPWVSVAGVNFAARCSDDQHPVPSLPVTRES